MTIKYRTLVASLLSTASILFLGQMPTNASAQQLASGLGIEIANAVAALARNNQAIEFEAVERELKLPNLMREIVWRGPITAYDDARFTASYSPKTSELGIEFVSIQWSVSTLPPYEVRLAQILTININPASCPTLASLEEAAGTKIEKLTQRGSHGGPSSTWNSIFIPQKNATPFSIGFYGVNTCHLTVGRSSELTNTRKNP